MRSNLTFRHNKLFSSNQKCLYKEFGGKEKATYEPPNKDEANKFWSKIWSEEGAYNDKATWIDDFKEFVEEEEVDQIDDY